VPKYIAGNKGLTRLNETARRGNDSSYLNTPCKARWGTSGKTAEAARRVSAGSRGVFVASTVAEVSGFPAAVSSGSPNCTPPGKTNSSTWNASQ